MLYLCRDALSSLLLHSSTLPLRLCIGNFLFERPQFAGVQSCFIIKSQAYSFIVPCIIAVEYFFYSRQLCRGLDRVRP